MKQKKKMTDAPQRAPATEKIKSKSNTTGEEHGTPETKLKAFPHLRADPLRREHLRGFKGGPYHLRKSYDRNVRAFARRLERNKKARK